MTASFISNNNSMNKCWQVLTKSLTFHSSLCFPDVFLNGLMFMLFFPQGLDFVFLRLPDVKSQSMCTKPIAAADTMVPSLSWLFFSRGWRHVEGAGGGHFLPAFQSYVYPDLFVAVLGSDMCMQTIVVELWLTQQTARDSSVRILDVFWICFWCSGCQYKMVSKGNVS